jgi:hypothetical protein
VGDFLTEYIGKQLKDMPIRLIYLKLFNDNKYFQEKYEDYDRSKCVNYITINAVFDFNQYLALTNDMQKKQMIVHCVRKELTTLFSERQWNIVPLHALFDDMKKRNYIWEGMLRPSWCNPNKKYRAKIWFRYELEEVQLIAILYHNRKPQNEICRRQFTTLIPTSWCVAPYVANVHWVSETILESQTPDFARKVTQVDFVDVMQ